VAELSAAQRTRLGLFLVVGGLLLAGSVALLAGLRLFEPRDLYRVRFKDSVSGLEVNSSVKYHGLRIGRVEAMRIAADDPSVIEVTLAIAAGTPLYQGAVAELDLSGLTGLKNVNVTGGDLRAGRISPDSELPAGASAVEELTTKAAEIVARLEVIANQLGRWTSDDNRQRFEQLLDGLNSFSRNSDRFLSHTEQPMVETLRAIAKTSSAVTSIAEEGTTTLQSLRGEMAQTLQAVRRPLEKVDPKDVAGAVAQARATFTELDRRISKVEFGSSLDALNDAIQRVNRLVQDLDLAVTASRQDFTMSLSYLREAAEDLREFSRLVAQDPSILIRGTEARE
jgi:phospholipid/cholesterol/gamma-HCH transport system substrate-binding protein